VLQISHAIRFRQNDAAALNNTDHAAWCVAREFGEERVDRRCVILSSAYRCRTAHDGESNKNVLAAAPTFGRTQSEHDRIPESSSQSRKRARTEGVGISQAAGVRMMRLR
jgi:hypothetical protein